MKLSPAKWSFVMLAGVVLSATMGRAADVSVIKPEVLVPFVERFNSMEDENITNAISNADSLAWLQKEIPLFDCPDKEVEEIYYFRWWSYRKHIVQTPVGFILTEFLTPVRHADIFNSISCADSFHLAEGRWMRDQNYLNDYTLFWLRGTNGVPPRKFHSYSSWLASAAYDRYLVNGDATFLKSLLNDFVADYGVWEQERQLTNGLFWQFDVRDGMEESISGSRTVKNARPTINSYMFANARAISAIAQLSGDKAVAQEFKVKADMLRGLTEKALWNPDAKFFEALRPDGTLSEVREELGYIPWMFELPGKNAGFEAAWSQLMDPQGFHAPAGIMTAERRHPQFRSHGVGTCEWDGAVWPFATSQTLYALANVLRDYQQNVVTAHDYFDTFSTYVHSQHSNGKPYIGEYFDEVTGDWINGKAGRSRYYNHSTFADILITGVVGLRPRADDVVEINPLLPAGTWDYFCLDNVPYHGRTLTILYDKTGAHYHKGQGLWLFADGKEIAHAGKLEKLTGKLP
ncbi:MAG TPA: glycosyl hydrolase family 65 protein [Verrucomicrobiae bacterium]|nr:glycosyl hydrolase family 65 protein [Verrucomicrobiae bacterium]